MVGIAGLLAKRRQASNIKQDSRNDSNRHSPQHSPAVDDIQDDIDITLDDPFSFDQRPSTSSSFGFNEAFMEGSSFESFHEDGCDETSTTRSDSSPTAQEESACKTTPPGTQAESELLAMPPPPPRPVSVPNVQAASIGSMQRVDEAIFASTTSQQECLGQEHAQNDPFKDNSQSILIRDEAPITSSNDVDNSPLKMANSFKLARPVETPAKAMISPASITEEACESSSDFGFTIQSTSTAATPPHTSTFSLGTQKQQLSSVTPESVENIVLRWDETFDKMHIEFLHDLQTVKDRHLQGDEQMMDMEVQLDHVIATIYGQILLMQQMDDALDEIEDTQEQILALHRE